MHSEINSTPVLEVVIEPGPEATRDHFAADFSKVIEPCHHVRARLNGAGELIFGAPSELKLAETLEFVRNHLSVTIGPPQIAFRETVTASATVDYTYKGRPPEGWQFARIQLTAEPRATLEPRNLHEHTGNKLSALPDVLPERFLSAAMNGLRSVVSGGALAGFPLIGLTVTIIAAAYHDTDSTPLAFEIAARAALREAIQKAQPALAEPMAKVDVETPAEFSFAITKDLRSRRADALEIEGGSDQTISAIVPVANMLGYERSLRELSRGTAKFASHFDSYRLIPRGDDPDFRPAIGMRA